MIRAFRGMRKNAPLAYVEDGLTNGPNNPDYEGAVFSDGTVAIRWLTLEHSLSFFPSWDMFYQVHGHPEYHTVIQFYLSDRWVDA